jgi:uncharacterized protein
MDSNPPAGIRPVARPDLQAHREEIAAFCRRNHIRRLSVFGSVLRDDFGPDSDVDVLYEFRPGHGVGFGIVQIEQELATILGVTKVDLVSAKYLNRWLRDRILASAEVQYEEG